VTLLQALQQQFPDSSKTTLRQMLQALRVRVNGEVEKDAKREIADHDVVDVVSKAVARQIPPGLTILHEDPDVIVVLKAHGLLHGGHGARARHHRAGLPHEYVGARRREDRVHVVHRLDRETSGVLVFAKNFHARERLKEQFAAHSVDRVVRRRGGGRDRSAARHHPLASVRAAGPEMVSVEPRADAKLSVTHYRTIKTNGKFSMLEVTLETGRKNQIRAHLSEKGDIRSSATGCTARRRIPSAASACTPSFSDSSIQGAKRR